MRGLRCLFPSPNPSQSKNLMQDRANEPPRSIVILYGQENSAKPEYPEYSDVLPSVTANGFVIGSSIGFPRAMFDMCESPSRIPCTRRRALLSVSQSNEARLGFKKTAARFQPDSRSQL